MGRSDRKKKKEGLPRRRSPRISKIKASGKPKSCEDDTKISFHDKTYDGFESLRMEKTLKQVTNYPGGKIYRGGEKLGSQPLVPTPANMRKYKDKEAAIQKVRDTVNGYKRKSLFGGNPCFDIIDEIGSGVYLYSLPVNLVRGLIQGFKTGDAVKFFEEKSSTISSHTGTNYLFLHWPNGTPEDFGDWTQHPFIKQRPDLETTIQSLGNWVREKVLLNKGLTCYQPGILANKDLPNRDDTHRPTLSNTATTEKTDDDSSTESEPTSSAGEGLPSGGPDPKPFTEYQPPHWDFAGWRSCAAKDMPWILHVPLCKEGMMLHVWPTGRDPATHDHKTSENLKLGSPEYIHVSFGDALLLRADVAHGGCFGSQGNSRFHMVFRKPEGQCLLRTDKLHFLDWAVDQSVFAEARVKLDNLGLPADFFGKAVMDGWKTVFAYIKRVQASYPCHVSWSEGLFDPIHFCHGQKVIADQDLDEVES